MVEQNKKQIKNNKKQIKSESYPDSLENATATETAEAKGVVPEPVVTLGLTLGVLNVNQDMHFDQKRPSSLTYSSQERRHRRHIGLGCN